MTHKIKRRDFLKLAGATGLLAAFPAPAFAQQQNVNSLLNIAFIGTGGMGGANVNAMGGENTVALCDTDANRLNEGRERFPNARLFRDYRKMFDEAEKEIDAIVVSTPDHTHAAASIMGMKLGKHCYTEKPMAHNVKEVRDMMAVAREKRVATQMGIQIHAGDNYRRVVELVRSRAIGTVNEVHVWCSTRWGGRTFQTDTPPVPDHIDWDLWLGPAAYRPYHPQYFGGAWRCFWAFGNGTIGDMACHYMDLPFWALNLVLPSAIEAFSETEPHPEATPAQLRVEYTFDIRRPREIRRPNANPPSRIPDFIGTLNWYDGGLRPTALIQEHGLPDWGNGVLFIGTEGMLLADYNRRVLFPEAKFADFQAPEQTIPNSAGHHREWINACKAGTQDTTCNFDYSGRLTEAVLLGAVAFRVGKKLEWDAQNMRATNAPEADQLLSREYRAGWEV